VQERGREPRPRAAQRIWSETQQVSDIKAEGARAERGVAYGRGRWRRR
jgi:hypothetical protein